MIGKILTKLKIKFLIVFECNLREKSQINLIITKKFIKFSISQLSFVTFLISRKEKTTFLLIYLIDFDDITIINLQS